MPVGDRTVITQRREVGRNRLMGAMALLRGRGRDRCGHLNSRLREALSRRSDGPSGPLVEQPHDLGH